MAKLNTNKELDANTLIVIQRIMFLVSYVRFTLNFPNITIVYIVPCNTQDILIIVDNMLVI
jgi:hypothetical protein